MLSRKTTLFGGARIAAFGLLSASAGLSSLGCGGSMAESASGWELSGFTAYGGNPSVEIQPASGAGSTGEFTVDNASPVTRTNETIFVEAIYTAEIRNVNTTASQTAGTFSAEWSEVLPSAGAVPRVTLNTPSGTTFSGYNPSASPNIRMNGISGNFLTVSTPGPVNLRLRVTLHASDGSSRTKVFFTTLNIVAPVGA